jgi:hypothetical protein
LLAILVRQNPNINALKVIKKKKEIGGVRVVQVAFSLKLITKRAA